VNDFALCILVVVERDNRGLAATRVDAKLWIKVWRGGGTELCNLDMISKARSQSDTLTKKEDKHTFRAGNDTWLSNKAGFLQSIGGQANSP
jgi:hypothetical protein